MAVFLASTISQPPAKADPAGNNIIISEVEYDLSTDENESEWFELYNPTPFPIDISGWTIQEGNGTAYTFPNYIVQPGAYVIVTNDQTEFSNRHPGVTADLEMDPGGSGLLRLNNGGDSLTLRNGPVATGDIVDFTAWEDYVAGWSAEAITDTSVCRDSSTDTDTGADLNDNCTPTPGTGDLTSKVTVEFSQENITSPEAGPVVQPSVTVSGFLTAPMTLTLTDAGAGTATAGSDYTLASPATITLPAGLYLQNNLNFSGLTINNDGDFEGDETIVFNISGITAPVEQGDANGDANTNATLTYTITNDDTQPVDDPDNGSDNSGSTTQPESPKPQLANTGSSIYLQAGLGIALLGIALFIRKVRSS